MTTTVEPSEFSLVHFDAAEIAALADDIASRIGLGPDVEIRVEIDESSALNRAELVSIDPIVITAESGALESQTRLRQFSREVGTDVLGRYLLRALDLRNPAFADAPEHDQLSLAQRAAWNVYVVGRMARAGYPVQRQRWLYTFRNRHGFTDEADAAFERLWNGIDLSWAEIDALSSDAAAVNPGALQR